MSATASHSIATLADRIGKLQQRAEAGMAEKVKTAAREMARHVILATPVDGGEARSNWRIGINEAPNAMAPAYAPIRPELGSKEATYEAGRYFETANAEAAIAACDAALTEYRLGDTIHVFNNVMGGDGHYLTKLDSVDGYSLQVQHLSGLHFMETARDIGVSEAEKVRIL